MVTNRAASPSPEALIDETIPVARERGYNSTVFIGMRRQYGIIDAIERLVQRCKAGLRGCESWAS
jgi:hypothetical protein